MYMQDLSHALFTHRIYLKCLDRCQERLILAYVVRKNFLAKSGLAGHFIRQMLERMCLCQINISCQKFV
jgi:hypothetical protein